MIDEFVRLLGSYPVGETDRKWFVMWIRRYQQFGGYPPEVTFKADRSKTLAFCRELLGNGTPAWQWDTSLGRYQPGDTAFCQASRRSPA